MCFSLLLEVVVLASETVAVHPGFLLDSRVEAWLTVKFIENGLSTFARPVAVLRMP